jgi:hypothetical protein
LFGSTDPNVWSGPGIGFDCYRSVDLVEWEGPVAAFRPPSGFWLYLTLHAPNETPNERAVFVPLVEVGADLRTAESV